MIRVSEGVSPLLPVFPTARGTAESPGREGTTYGQDSRLWTRRRALLGQTF